MMKIRQLLRSEIPQLQNFPPEDWNIDLPRLLFFHFGHTYFYPIIAEMDGRIVGCGNGYLHGKIGWLGNIIVLADYRRQGIGQTLTIHLMEYFKSKGCSSQLLIASEMGEPLYRKLGFETSSTYVLYKREPGISTQHISRVRKVKKEDIQSIKELDKKITGEERFHLIERFLPTGLVYSQGVSDNAEGVYLPDFGSGLIIAKNAMAGQALMKVRLNEGKTTVIVPSVNDSAREFLESEGFQVYRKAPRMVLGEEVQWQPTMLYNRATGYCG